MEYFDYTDVNRFLEVEEFEIDRFLDRFQDNEIDRLQKKLDRIESQTEERERIHREAVDELETGLDQYIERLHLLYRQWSSRNRTKPVKDRITELYQKIRNEKRSSWKDKQKLEQERRALKQEIDEVLDSFSLAENIDL
ncbi:hypothetical protein ACLI4R_14455 [Natrialbaceae archaeon A-chndr2]